MRPPGPVPMTKARSIPFWAASFFAKGEARTSPEGAVGAACAGFAVDDDTATVVNQSITVAEGALNTALTPSDLESTDADTNDAATAAEHGRHALNAADHDDSGFRYHPSVGLVGDEHLDIINLMKSYTAG